MPKQPPSATPVRPSSPQPAAPRQGCPRKPSAAPSSWCPRELRPRVLATEPPFGSQQKNGDSQPVQPSKCSSAFPTRRATRVTIPLTILKHLRCPSLLLRTAATVMTVPRTWRQNQARPTSEKDQQKRFAGDRQELMAKTGNTLEKVFPLCQVGLLRSLPTYLNTAPIEAQLSRRGFVPRALQAMPLAFTLTPRSGK